MVKWTRLTRGTLQEVLDDIEGRLDTVEGAAGIDPNVGSSLATQVSDNTSCSKCHRYCN